MLWRWGGMTLGTITGLLGRNAIMACTDAIETAVARVSFSLPPSLSLFLSPSILGRNAIMTCTDAIETAVARVSSPSLPLFALPLSSFSFFNIFFFFHLLFLSLFFISFFISFFLFQ